MLKMNEVLKASKLGGGAPNYWTELFARRMAGGWKVTELTGTLPLTFRSNGDDILNYRIYGTADGAGVQTENLLGKSLFTDGKTANSTGAIVYNGFRTATEDAINVNSSTAYFAWETDVNGVQSIVSGYDENDNYIGRMFVSSGTVVNTSEYYKVRFTFFTNISMHALKISEIDNIIFVKGSTAPETYIPYGYKLPLKLTSGTESKDTDIYIGDSKLLSSDYVDYESGKIVRDGTPQDPPLPFPKIETFKGENTLSSTETLGEVTIKGIIKGA